MLQPFLGFREAMRFPGDACVLWVLSSVAFFLRRLAFPDRHLRGVGKETATMMTLIAIAITTAYAYSSIVVFGLKGKVFFCELGLPPRPAFQLAFHDPGYYFISVDVALSLRTSCS